MDPWPWEACGLSCQDVEKQRGETSVRMKPIEAGWERCGGHASFEKDGKVLIKSPDLIRGCLPCLSLVRCARLTYLLFSLRLDLP